MTCIFCDIIKNKPAETTILYETDELIAIADRYPQAPVHQLIIPKKHITTLNDLTEADIPLIGTLINTATFLAEKAGIAQTGYRTLFNCNQDGGQAVFHIHLHLLGGRSLLWPPG